MIKERSGEKIKRKLLERVSQLVHNKELSLLQILFSYSAQKVRANIDNKTKILVTKGQIKKKTLTQRKNYYLNELKVKVTKNQNLEIQFLIHLDAILHYCCSTATPKFARYFPQIFNTP